MRELNELFAEAVDVGSFGDAEQSWSALPSGGGVYAFCDEADHLIQLAGSQSLRRSIKHRLSRSRTDAGPNKRADLGAVTRRVRWIPTHSPFETALVYYRIARRLYPKTYRKLVAFGPAWFIHVDPVARLPRFAVTNRVYQHPGRYWGPFPTRSEAADAVSELEDLFDLCRYHDVLDSSPRGQACAYSEMNKCPAPCDGSITIPAYKEMVERARSFAWGQRDAQIDSWRSEMRSAADGLSFERAAVLKSRIERGAKLMSRNRASLRDADEFNFLIVQRAGGSSWVKPFFVTRGRIEQGDRVRIKTLPDVLGDWAKSLTAQREGGPGSQNALQRAEQVWLVSHFLFKGSAAAGCFLHESELDPPGRVLDRLRTAFPPRARKKDSGVADGRTQGRMEPPGGVVAEADPPGPTEGNRANPD